MKTLLTLLFFAFTSCGITEGIRQSNNNNPVVVPPCDHSVVIEDWVAWKAEVCRIQCVQVKMCEDDPDFGIKNPGFGYALSLWLKDYSPCAAAETIIKQRKLQYKP